ncbi:hypothetical protein PR048_001146 [Dryococelus australis]|uniref:Uncharacterized protein n=1 Tax=Dryococelus australis TaxID=614101 RepID=A0ABQ9IIZ8_9NEOP|nr:hypothetical protein PR048_001146 [Dryococelus australis]
MHNLKKVMEKIWPYFKFFESSEAHNEAEFLELLKGIPGCDDAIDANVDEWMAADGASNENLTDKYIVTAVNQETDPSRLK